MITADRLRKIKLYAYEAEMAGRPIWGRVRPTTNETEYERAECTRIVDRVNPPDLRAAAVRALDNSLSPLDSASALDALVAYVKQEIGK